MNEQIRKPVAVLSVAMLMSLGGCAQIGKIAKDVGEQLDPTPIPSATTPTQPSPKTETPVPTGSPSTSEWQPVPLATSSKDFVANGNTFHIVYSRFATTALYRVTFETLRGSVGLSVDCMGSDPYVWFLNKDLADTDSQKKIVNPQQFDLMLTGMNAPRPCENGSVNPQLDTQPAENMFLVANGLVQ